MVLLVYIHLTGTRRRRWRRRREGVTKDIGVCFVTVSFPFPLLLTAFRNVVLLLIFTSEGLAAFIGSA